VIVLRKPKLTSLVGEKFHFGKEQGRLHSDGERLYLNIMRDGKVVCHYLDRGDRIHHVLYLPHFEVTTYDNPRIGHENMT